MDDTQHSTMSKADKKKKKKKEKKQMASLGETLSFVFECGGMVQFLFFTGVLAGILNGLVFPALAYVFSNSFGDIAGAASNGLDNIRELAFIFMGVGVYALGVGTIQGWSFELVAYYASQNFRLKWFNALLRQDSAFYDVHDISGVAGQVGSNSNKFRRGIGRKFGEGVQFATTGVGGVVYAMYVSWRVALVVLSVVPLVSLAAIYLMSLNQTKGTRMGKSYERAGNVAYSAVSAIKTVLSLNAVQDMVNQYKDATEEAFQDALNFLMKHGLASGSMLGSFLFLYAILTMYGTSLLYNNIQTTGCDPSGSVVDNETCESTGADVFGAMLGIAFAAQGISQVGNFLEAFASARVAAYQALVSINRKPGAAQEIIYKKDEDDIGSTTHHSKKSKTVSDAENGESLDEVKAVIPKFEIDSSSTAGLKPKIKGGISLKNVHFSYPTRPQDQVLQGLSIDIEAGQTVALVGPSGGGKSTVVAMMERFYDPLAGAITLDGVNLKDINVSYLRKNIGYVGQEPALFATTIRGNIRYGNPNATQEQIEEAARLANAHDFIEAFTDGYDTQVGDKGGQLSGGQKQRIAIARVLIANPSILLLDEATSALDSESELVVQDALDNIVEQKKITTIIIAHRLSTIRNADKINVVAGGRVLEQGTHDELMTLNNYYCRLVEKQEGKDGADQLSRSSSRNGSAVDLTRIGEDVVATPDLPFSTVPHLEFKNVSFSYPSRPKKMIFDNFNLSIKQGETVALVGKSGGGKSTVVGLVERFYDPLADGGQILYLGSDIQSLQVDWYRRQLGLVSQEPTLFNMTIGENIAFGAKGVTRADIEEAARQANAFDFVVEFPDGFETLVGTRGTQLSGGQKQRIGIARALCRKPKVLILDEATSALDSHSEAAVQAAIDKLMASRDHTVIVIAHRLSTIRNADRIALLDSGKVLEFGSHDQLIQNPKGRYTRLFESSKRRSTVESIGLRRSTITAPKEGKDEEEEEEVIDWEAKIQEDEENAFSLKRARQMASPDTAWMLAGAIGAVAAGGVFPLWGVLFSQTIDLLFRRVEACPLPDDSIPGGFPSCQAYQDDIAQDMRTTSFQVAGYWIGLFAMCIVGNIITSWGFGTASERLSKRVRDSSFLALLRQDVSFFDKRSVGSITSQLQDDAARIQAFSGAPIRSFVIAISSVVTGVVISLIFMWPFALLAIGCIPIMAFATSINMKMMLGEDEGDADAADELNSPGGVLVETLLNIRTVSALTLEKRRYRDYEAALFKSEPNHRREAFMSGVTAGLSVFLQQWINALQFFFGGWLIFTYPLQYDFSDFLISQFSILFSLFGLGSAFQDISDRKEVEKSAGRIFYLLDRKSSIDPLSPEGKKLD